MEITKKNLKYFELAKNVSKASTYKQHNLGCVLVYKGKHVLSVGWNMDKTHPVQQKYNKYRNLDGDNVIAKAHAEIIALNKIKDLDIEFSNVEVYVWRNHKNGKRALARPCRACSEMIRQMGIKTVYYSIEDGFACEKVG